MTKLHPAWQRAAERFALMSILEQQYTCDECGRVVLAKVDQNTVLVLCSDCNTTSASYDDAYEYCDGPGLAIGKLIV